MIFKSTKDWEQLTSVCQLDRNPRWKVFNAHWVLESTTSITCSVVLLVRQLVCLSFIFTQQKICPIKWWWPRRENFIKCLAVCGKNAVIPSDLLVLLLHRPVQLSEDGWSGSDPQSCILCCVHNYEIKHIYFQQTAGQRINISWKNDSILTQIQGNFQARRI